MNIYNGANEGIRDQNEDGNQDHQVCRRFSDNNCSPIFHRFMNTFCNLHQGHGTWRSRCPKGKSLVMTRSVFTILTFWRSLCMLHGPPRETACANSSTTPTYRFSPILVLRSGQKKHVRWWYSGSLGSAGFSRWRCASWSTCWDLEVRVSASR